MEDLVREGVASNACPYYASRELVHYANINLCTYMYLLDPIIRKECKFEAAIKNHAVVIFDEAHHVSSVCQDVLTVDAIPMDHIARIREELQPLTVCILHTPAVTMPPLPPEGGVAATQLSSSSCLPSLSLPGSYEFNTTYPRDFKLTQWTLRELFSFLDCDVLGALVTWSYEQRQRQEQQQQATMRSGGSSTSLSSNVVSGLDLFTSSHHHHGSSGGHPRHTDPTSTPSTPLLHIPQDPPHRRLEWMQQFKQIYGIVMSLGVTFNPFEISVWALGVLKRILLVLRFTVLHPKAFCAWTSWSLVEDDNNNHHQQQHDNNNNHQVSRRHRGDPQSTTTTTATPASSSVVALTIRCLDGSLAFHHLARSSYAVILASGTLGPMPQLRSDLKLAPQRCDTLETMHVVNVETQFRIGVVGRMMNRMTKISSSSLSCTDQTNASNMNININDTTTTTTTIECTYRNMNDPRFVQQITSTCLNIVDASLAAGSGALIFAPNYRTAKAMSEIASTLLAEASRQVAASYSTTQHLHSQEQQTTQRRRLRNLQCLIEPRDAEHMPDFLEAHRRAIQVQHKRSILFAVYRGKVSEGLDFVGDLGRLVICVGIPLQPITSRTVEAQRMFSGEGWYRTDAVRAVNQAIGRCLRHAEDYGAVVLLDQRYETNVETRQQLPRWCRENVQSWSTVDSAVDDLQRFFIKNRSKPMEGTKKRNRDDGGLLDATSGDQHLSSSSTYTAPTTKPTFFGLLNDDLAMDHVSNTTTTRYAASQPTVALSGSRNNGVDDDENNFVVQCAQRQHPQHNRQKNVVADSHHTPPSVIMRSTALKLLYEAVDDVRQVRKGDVDAMVERLVDDDDEDDNGGARPQLIEASTR